ncbi:hypothetical protein SK128_014242 [Halocaridina rubra]|uniref:Uncharacterized protein n=1 Tax=Halocaridina rubra TaxID=373956 RepID=A0AAN8XPT0_HALRR
MLLHSRSLVSAVVGNTCRLTTLSAKNAAETRSLIFRSSRACVPAISSMIQMRYLHSVKLSRNLEFFSSTNEALPKDTMELGPALGNRKRPMTLLFAWLMSREKHIHKYCQFYNNLGIDVLKVRISPYDLLRPTKGAQCVADQVLQFLHSNPSHNPLMIHGFSVGAYVFTEAMVKVEKEYEKHSPLLNRFVGQIWDSAVDIDGIPYGTSRAITNNVTLQKSMQKYLEWYLKVRYHSATIHYERASAKMHQNYVGVPALFFISNSDPVATPEMVAKVYKKWEAKGYPVYTKCWEHSRHVSHYRMHPKEYEELVLVFLEKIGMIEPARQAASSC